MAKPVSRAQDDFFSKHLASFLLLLIDIFSCCSCMELFWGYPISKARFVCVGISRRCPQRGESACKALFALENYMELFLVGVYACTDPLSMHHHLLYPA